MLVAGPSGTASSTMIRDGGNVLVAGPSGTASSTTRNIEVFPPPGEDCPYNIVMDRKYEHPGAPLSGAYCVEMLQQRNRAKYDKEIQYRVCKFLRHDISKTSGLTIWPDGFVNLKELLEMVRRSGYKFLFSGFLYRSIIIGHFFVCQFLFCNSRHSYCPSKYLPGAAPNCKALWDSLYYSANCKACVQY